MQTPYRILYLCHDGDLYGSQQSLTLILKHMDKRLVEPYVSIARSGPLQDILSDIPGVCVLKHRRLQWVKHDKRHFFQRVGDILNVAGGLIPRVWSVIRLIRQYRIQLVHTNSSVSLEGALAAWLTGTPHIWHIRELFMEKSPKYHLVFGRYASRRVMVSLSNRLICISKAVQGQFLPYLDKHAEKFPVIYNAVEGSPKQEGDKEKEAALPADNCFNIGYLGRLSAGKRFHDILEALAHLPPAFRQQVCLTAAGRFADEEYRQRVEGIVKAFDLQDIVNLSGFVTDTSGFFKDLDLLILPSVNEPFGRVLIEAMLAGVPCLAADSGGVPEIIEEGVTGFLYPAADPLRLAECILWLLEDPGVLQRIRHNAGRMVAQRFNIEAQCRRIASCYEELLS